jgi:hypothetical protein
LKDKIKNKLIKTIIKIIRIKSDTKENLIAYFDHLRATEGNWDEERGKREEKKKKKEWFIEAKLDDPCRHVVVNHGEMFWRRSRKGKSRHWRPPHAPPKSDNLSHVLAHTLHTPSLLPNYFPFHFNQASNCQVLNLSIKF